MVILTAYYSNMCSIWDVDVCIEALMFSCQCTELNCSCKIILLDLPTLKPLLSIEKKNNNRQTKLYKAAVRLLGVEQGWGSIVSLSAKRSLGCKRLATSLFWWENKHMCFKIDITEYLLFPILKYIYFNIYYTMHFYCALNKNIATLTEKDFHLFYFFFQWCFSYNKWALIER